MNIPKVSFHFSLFLFLLIALFVGVYLVSQNQDTRSKAKSVATTVEFRRQNLGVFAVNTFEDEQRTGSSFENQTYQNPNIVGVTFRTSWQDIEPREGVLQWGKLDQVFERAQRNNKRVRLILVPGFGTPKWALKDVQTVIFTIKYGRGNGEDLPLPLPWDTVYQNRWFEFLRKINKRYGSNPSFVMIAAAGPTSVSSEMSLPNSPEDLEKWRAVGYTSGKYIEAWKKTLATYAAIFPNQFISLALYPGLPIPDKSERDRVRQEVAVFGAQALKGKFALQTSGLNPLKDDDEGAGYLLVKEFGPKYNILSGFMMSSAFTQKEDKYGPALEALRDAITRGLEATINYLEIYEADILNTELQNELARAATALKPEPTANPTPTPTLTPTPTPKPPITWALCIQNPESIITQSFPRVCRTPDGQRVTEPTPTNTQRPRRQ